MTREELKPQNKLQREFGRDFTNSEGYFSTDYVEWLENKLLSLPPADATAEEILDKRLNFSLGSAPSEDSMNAYLIMRQTILAAMREFAAQRQPQPTAEGAEEFLYSKNIKHNPYLMGIDGKHSRAADLLTEFATLTADKIVEGNTKGKFVLTYDELQNICCDFFRHWWNVPGTNTMQGFDAWALKTHLKTRSHE